MSFILTAEELRGYGINARVCEKCGKGVFIRPETGNDCHMLEVESIGTLYLMGCDKDLPFETGEPRYTLFQKHTKFYLGENMQSIFVEVTEKEVLEHLEKFDAIKPDQREEGNRLLSIGLAVVKRVQASQDVDFVKKETEAMVHAVNRSLNDMTAALQSALSKSLADNTGAFASAGKEKTEALVSFFQQNIETFKASVEGDVDALKTLATSNLKDVRDGVDLASKSFDPANEGSYFGKVRAAFVAMVQAFEKQFDEQRADSFASKIRLQSESLFGENSPLVAKVLAIVQDSENKMRSEVVALREEIARKEGEATAMELASQKGFVFEDELNTKLGEMAKAYGDLVEYTGATTGGSTSKKGDFLYRFSEGQEIVIEAKDEAIGVKPMLAYMAEAMKTRGVSFGILVTRKAEQLQKQVGEINLYDNVLFVAAENLPFALRWVRLYLTRVKSQAVEGIDKGAVVAELSKIAQALVNIKSVKQKLTVTAGGVQTAVNQVAEMLDAMKSGIDDSLSSLEAQFKA